MLGTQVANHQAFDEKFDTELVKARRPPCNYNCTCGLAHGDISAAIMPAPKIWRRKQLSSTQSLIPVKELLTRADSITEMNPASTAIIEMNPASTADESTPIDLDEWSRDFLLLVELND